MALERRSLVIAAGLLVLALSRGDHPALLAQDAPQDSGATVRTITLTARKYAFSQARIEVNQDDVVTITLKAEDIPHSFTVDAYRIAKKATPGKPVTFQFRASRAGTFPFYCNLTIDDGCRKMRGELVVKAKP
jgi:heme/copper-type cytochrome/quinol oxidase subunit 2